MFNLFRAKKIEKQLKEEVLNNPFNYELSENYQIEKDDPITINNSYYFSAHSTDKKQSLYCRLGIRKEYMEVWLYYFESGHKYYLEEMIYNTNSPLKIIKEENVWNIRFSGLLKKNSKDQVRCTLDLNFSTEESPIDFIGDVEIKKFSKILAKEKYDEQTYKQIKNNHQVYYEEFGVLQGKMLLEGQHIAINLPCVKNHSYGFKEWGYINNHLKIIAMNKESHMNFHMVSNKHVSMYEVGTYKSSNKNNEIKHISKALFERAILLKGTAPDNLNMLLQTEDETNIDVHIKKLDELYYSFQEGEYMIYECIAEFLINGKMYRGILEVGYNKDQNRWFNNKDITKLVK